ncbi:protein amnionless [Orussus abietinus]|uniref:protein amnionless n=1 Tax=Orussus abietinus TaxID=222816 RepID=UPI000626D9D4|nr:protein amnionless [Orussus abietinus]
MSERTHGCGIFLFSLAAIFWKLELAGAIEKFWLPDLEWQTRENWENGLLPEVDSRVVFPEEMRLAVGLPKWSSVNFAEVDLPRDGSLALSMNGKLQISGSEGSKKRVAKWARKGPLFWADPENWSTSSEAVPHLERIPCVSDVAVLANSTDKILSIRQPDNVIKVRAVKIENRSLLLWQWTELRSNREFSTGPFKVDYSLRLACDNCPCQGDNFDAYLEEVCNIQRPRCGSTICAYPLEVEGHCCDFCGGRVRLSRTTPLSTIESKVSDILKTYDNVLSWHIRNTKDGNPEVLIAEKDGYSGMASYEAVEALKKALTGNYIEVLSTETAGAALNDSNVGLVLASVLGTPFLIFLLFVVVLPYFGYNPTSLTADLRRGWTTFRTGVRQENGGTRRYLGFARFENVSEATVQLAEPAEPRETPPATYPASGSGGRFENPLYRSKKRGQNEENILDIEKPVRLTTLKNAIGDEDVEEVDLEIEQ